MIFRLTQEEYQHLESISGGARSLSDFARSKVLGAGESAATPSLAEIQKKLDDLTGAVEVLARALQQP